jgi:ssDNA-binding Zn-finger/Zn-ribbon topoisomerase 1
MLKIEYARLTRTPVFIQKVDTESKRLIDLNYDRILHEYDMLAIDLMAKEKLEFASYQERLDCFKTKHCAYCGGTLLYIDYNGGFWGCDNYKTISGSHTTFSGLDPNIVLRVEMPRDPLHYILNNLNLEKKIKHKPLYEFLMAEGREDLCLKYGFSSMETLFNGRQKGKQRSLVQEKKALDYLNTKYKIVIPQQCITYKLDGEKECFCIPDFICSNPNEVLIADAKLCFLDEKQLHKYVELIRFIMNKKGDNRPVKGSFIVYKGEFNNEDNNNYSLIEIN